MAPLPQGEVFSWGINDFGQLGNGTTDYASAPQIIQWLVGVFISDVASGGWHSMALTSEGGEAEGGAGCGMVGVGLGGIEEAGVLYVCQLRALAPAGDAVLACVSKTAGEGGEQG